MRILPTHVRDSAAGDHQRSPSWMTLTVLLPWLADSGGPG
jgi:hypothetical protein